MKGTAQGIVGLSRSRVYELRDEDSEYRREWDDAIARALGRRETKGNRY